MRRTSWQSTDLPVDILAQEDDRGLVIHIPSSISVMNPEAILSTVLSEWRLAERPKRVVLNLNEATHIDSSGMGILIELVHRAAADDVPLLLCGLQPLPRHILERTGLIGWFAICTNVEQALDQRTPAV